MITKYVNPDTGTDDGAAGRGDSALDPYASVLYAVNSVRGAITIEMAAVAYSAETVVIERPEPSLFRRTF